MNISKDRCTNMRGWAIMSIAMHNFFHLKEFGLAQENETHFSSEGIKIFLENAVGGYN